MMKQLQGLLYFYAADLRFSFTVFWSVLLSFLGVSLIIAYLLLNVDGAKFLFGFPVGAYGYAGIIGFLMVKEYIPYSLKFGAVRKNIYLAIGLFFLAFSFFMAILSSTFQSLAVAFIDAIDLHIMHIIHPALIIGNDTWLTRIVMDTAIMFTIAVVLFVIGLLLYRGGLITGSSVVGLLLLFLLFGVAQGFLFEYLQELYHSIRMMYFFQVFAFGIVLFAFCYIFVKGITTVKKR